MDAIELGRQRAAALHADLVTQGCDPWKPMDIARLAAASLGIDEVLPLPKGSPLLAASRAKYDPRSHSIVYEDCGDSFLNAFLIGHEVGHAALGDDRIPCAALELDPARPSEAAPVGEERVADYSSKSRREIQMDLFSRELLMPRSLLRRLHLEGMTAAAIAAALGAPYDAVAQQLLDALLLPEVVLDDDEIDRFPLNERQERAATHSGKAFLLEAGPGTGKTKTLVGRVAHLVDVLKEDPRTIAVLTYSNKAAGELSARIAAKAPEAAAAMWIGTFHAFGLNLVRQFHRELNFEREPRLLDRAEAIDLMLSRVAGLDLTHYRDLYDPTDKLRDLLNAISRAQDEVVLAPRYAELIDEMLARDGSATMRERTAKAKEVAAVYASYSDIKRQSGRIDFGDLVALPTDLLERRSDIAATLRGTFKHILVDEYQDVNRASVRLLQQLTDGGRNLWCVGDVRQSIYRFRGASSFNLGQFDSDDFPNGERGHLTVNYRSHEEIVDVYSAFAEDIAVAGATPAHLEAFRGKSGHGVEFRHVVGDKQREIDGVADSVEAMRASGYAYSDQALLCSGNDRLAEIGQGLESRGIPVLYLGSLFERPEVKDLLAWLSLLVDPRAMALARGTGAAGIALDLADVAAIAASLRDNESAPLAWLTEHPKGLSDAGKVSVAAYASLLAGFDAASDPWNALSRMILDRCRYAADIAGATDVAGRAKGIAIWQFMNFVRSQPRGRPGAIAAMLDRIRRLVRLSDDRDLRQIPAAASGIDAVRLMTMHGSKGLEFPVVHIPGMNLNTLPNSPSAPPCPPPDGMIAGTEERGREITDREHREEQQCLFYVALSRARDRLFLYAASQTASGASRQASPFVARLGGGLISSKPHPVICGSAHVEPPVAVKFQGAVLFSQSELGLYERCPRRFFYTHILKLGGRRATTPYEDMHDLVRLATREMIRFPIAPTDSASLAALVDQLWSASPLEDFPAGAAYRPLADELIRRFAAKGGTAGCAAAPAYSFSVAGATVRVEADYLIGEGTGGAVLRQIRTGHRTGTEMDKSAAVMVPVLARASGAMPCDTEIIFLSDDMVEPLELTPIKLKNRRATLEDNVAKILAGDYPFAEKTRNCPKCPAFFHCGPVTPGPVEKKFA